MLYANGKPVGNKEAIKILDYSKMRDQGIGSIHTLIHFAKKEKGVECCNYHWTFEKWEIDWDQHGN